MATTSRKNLTVKALQSVLANGKKHDANIQLEWELSCNTNVNRGKVYKQEELIQLYSRRVGYNEECGATKVCHLTSHNGDDFKYIVIKRMRNNAYIPDADYEHEKCTGNQLIDEINCWLEFEETETADLLCPILKYFTSKSDKVTATSETMCNNVVIIAQRAVYVGDASEACRKAEYLNRLNGYHTETAEDRLVKLKALSKAQGWRDAIHNPGNSGVIFDHNKNCYKAVFIDYAL
jgi:hypothetical protein